MLAMLPSIVGVGLWALQASFRLSSASSSAEHLPRLPEPGLRRARQVAWLAVRLVHKIFLPGESVHREHRRSQGVSPVCAGRREQDEADFMQCIYGAQDY